MQLTEAYPRLMEEINDLRRQWRVQQVIEGVLLALAGVAAVLLVVVAADNLFQLGKAGRFVLALGLWGGLVAGLLGLVVRRWLEDRRDDYFAARVEQKHPELHNYLINALQLGRGNQDGFSVRMIEKIVLDAADKTADLEMSDCLSWKPAGVAAGLLGGAVAAIALYALVLPQWFGRGLDRVLRPLADSSYTQIVESSIKPGDGKDNEGAPVTIEARVQGIVPKSAKLFIGGDKTGWTAKEMRADPAAPDTFRFTIPQARDSFDYYIAAGDGQSRQYQLEIVKLPTVESFALTYTPPAYTALPSRQVAGSDGEVSGLAGTQVAVELKASKALAEAKLITESGEAIDLKKGGDDRTWLGSFIVWSRAAKLTPEITGRLVQAPTRYQVKLLDTQGYQNADPLWRSIALARDQAPAVAVTSPGRNMQVKPGSAVPLIVEARDDFGVGAVQLLYKVNDEPTERVLTRFPHEGAPELQTGDRFNWNLSSLGLKSGARIDYWARVVDRNTITGPGLGESQRFTVTIETPEEAVAKLDLQIDKYVEALEELVKLQSENRAQTASGVAFETLALRQTRIRGKTRTLARVMEKDGLPTATIVKALDGLAAGLMAQAVKLLEAGKDAPNERASELRGQSLPVQDKIIEQLKELLARLQRNEQAKEALRRLQKKDPQAHKAAVKTLTELVKNLDRLLKDETELAGKFERLPKKPTDELKEEQLKASKELDEFARKWEKWAKGTVNELTKLPEGFIKDFDMRPDVNKVFEEIEKAAQRAKAQNMDVALEDLGAGLGTRMKEDLEMWMPDAPDAVKWVQEEPLNKKNMKIPEMPLPKALEDLVGDLLQKAEEFDEEADDVTSAWGDNLDQAGWGVSDGPISSFSAKGKTGNDQPNNQEVTGRSGDGRRGKSAGQMVGDTARALPGRKTPARVGKEQYEPGQLKKEGSQDPNGATGGGKLTGAGRKGLQGGTPPPALKNDMERLSEKQAGVREKAEQVAQKLDTLGITNPKLRQSIELMRSVEKDLRDLRYDDAARKRRDALRQLRGAFTGVDQSTAAQLSRARDLPPQLRTELLQGAEEGYPAGYESLLKSYFKALSQSEK